MADEMNGEIFDINLSTSVDTSELDKLSTEIDKYNNKEIDITLNPKWTKGAEKTINKFKDAAVTMNVKLDVPDDIKKTTSQLSRLATIMERLSKYSGKNGTVSVSPTVGGGTVQTAPNKSEVKAINTATSNTQTLSKDIGKFQSAVKEYVAARAEFESQVEQFNSGFYKKNDNGVKFEITDIIADYNDYANAFIKSYNKLKTFSPELLKEKSINIDPDAIEALTGQYDIESDIADYINDAVESINNDIKEGIWKAKRDITKEDFGINYGSLRNQMPSTTTVTNTSVPLSQTIPIDMSAFAGAMSLSFDNEDISSIKTSVGNIETSVGNIYTSLQGGIPISGTSQSDSNKKPESIKLDASNLITALSDLKTSIDAKEAIIEKDANNKRIIKDNSKAQVTVDQLNAAIAESESNFNRASANNKTIYNGIYNKMQKLVEDLKRENKDIYDNLGKNFLDVSDEQLDSFIKKLESLQEGYKINIDVDIPNLEDFNNMYSNLKNLAKLEKANSKETTKKSKTKAVTPSVAKKEETTTAPVTAEVKLPENLEFLDKNTKQAIDDIKTAVESINGKIKEPSEADKPKSKSKAKTAKEPEQADAKSLLTKALSEAIGDIQNSNLEIVDNTNETVGSLNSISEEINGINQTIGTVKTALDDIHTDLQNGIPVTNNGSGGNNPTPVTPPSNVPSSGGNPKPKNPAPQNPTPLPSRTRNEISGAAEKELRDITKKIEAINFLLRQTGGITESVLPKDDVKRTLNDLTAINSQLQNITSISNKKNFGAKDLIQINDYLTDVENKLQNITPETHNIIGLVSRYSDAFKNEKIDSEVYTTYAKLKEVKDALENAHVDTSQYDKAIAEIDAHIERLENTAESWRSTSLTPDQIDTARDAVTQMSDELTDAIKKMQSLADNANDQTEDIFKFDDEIKELNRLENKIISFYKIIQDLRRRGVDPSSVVFGNGYNFGDAESLIQEYFNKKDTLNQYSQGQFASEAEFEQYRNSIRAGLIEPINEYISHANDAKIATENLKTANKELADEVRDANSSLTLDKQIENKITELNKWREANSRAMTIPKNAAEFERFMNKLNSKTITDPTQMKAFNAEWAEFNKRIIEAGQSGKTTTSILAAMYKKFGGWTLVTRTITQAIRLMKDMVVQVKEVDTAMVNLRKVTDASEQSLEKYQQTAAKASIKLGTSLTDQIDATSIFSRLGYELDEAEKLGEIASTYKSVAEDLDIDTASQSIISTLKAYQGLGTTAEEIVDKFNYVGKMLPLITISVKGQRCLRPR